MKLPRRKTAHSPKVAVISLLILFLVSGVLITPHVYAFSNGQAASIVIGQPDFVSQTSAGQSPNRTNLFSPAGIAFDASGDLWVADSASSRVLEFKTPLTTDEVASIVIGKPNFTVSSDACSSSTIVNPSCLNVPSAVAFDSSGNLWVSDALNSRVLEFTAPFTSGENSSIVLGRDNFTTGNSPDATPSANTLSSATGEVGGLTFDSSGDLWVADSGWNRVLEFKPPFSNGEAASIVIGQQNFTSGVFPNYPSCQEGQACPTASSLQDPTDVKFDSSGNLWIADSAPFRILEFKPPFSNGMSASLVIGEPDFSTYRGGSIISCEVTPAANCINPYAIAFDKSGNLWVADADFDRALRFDAPFSNGENASIVLGQPNFTSGPPVSGVNATATDMGTPGGIAVDASGNVWVSDQGFNRILEFSASGVGISSTSSSSSSFASSSTSSSSALQISATTSATPILTSSAQATTSSSSVAATTQSSTTTSSSSSSAISLNYIAVIVLVVFIAATAFVAVLRRGRTTSPG